MTELKGSYVHDGQEVTFSSVPDAATPRNFVPTLENVRTYYARQHIPDILELGPPAGIGEYYLVVERDAPESCRREVNRMCPKSIGTPYNNLLLAVDGDSMVLRYCWTREEPATAIVPEPTQSTPQYEPRCAPLTLGDVREYFATRGQGMRIGPDDIVALGPESRPGVYPVLLRNMEDWHVARVRERIPDLPMGYNNELMVSHGLMAIRYAC